MLGYSVPVGKSSPVFKSPTAPLFFAFLRSSAPTEPTFFASVVFGLALAASDSASACARSDPRAAAASPSRVDERSATAATPTTAITTTTAAITTGGRLRLERVSLSTGATTVSTAPASTTGERSAVKSDADSMV